jgi:hypothetical protein
MRFCSQDPLSIGRTFAHAAGAFAVMELMPRVERLVAGANGDQARMLAAVFFVVLPGLTYVWLASIWLIRLAQRDKIRVR